MSRIRRKINRGEALNEMELGALSAWSDADIKIMLNHAPKQMHSAVKSKLEEVLNDRESAKAAENSQKLEDARSLIGRVSMGFEQRLTEYQCECIKLLPGEEIIAAIEKGKDKLSDQVLSALHHVLNAQSHAQGTIGLLDKCMHEFEKTGKVHALGYSSSNLPDQMMRRRGAKRGAKRKHG